MLERAIVPFKANGIRMPWYQVFGNHDGLLQGNAPKNPVFNTIATGPLKVTGIPGLDPCDSFDILQHNPAALLAAPAHVVGADADRRIVSHGQYIAEHFRSPAFPGPVGHGFTNENLANDTGYYVIDDADPRFRLIALDTLNPGGYEGGSIGQNQFDWLVAKLSEVSSRHLDDNGNWVTTGNRDKLVILFSHHGLRSLDNPLTIPSTSAEEFDTSDLPRKMADEVQAAIQRFPNVIAWVNGHTHNNIVTPQPGPAGGFWDIGTAAHVDWNSQSRLIEVIDNADGTLSILCTMFDHAAPLDPTGTTDPVLRLASINRELSANDPQKGFNSAGPGHVEDRNVELVIKAPFPLRHGATHSSMLWLPKTPIQTAGAAMVAGAAAVIRRRQLLEKRLDG
jgi:metallophosphoesterase (TIGR03767 family)